MVEVMYILYSITLYGVPSIGKKVLSNGIDDDIKGYLNELAKEY